MKHPCDLCGRLPGTVQCYQCGQKFCESCAPEAMADKHYCVPCAEKLAKDQEYQTRPDRVT